MMPTGGLSPGRDRGTGRGTGQRWNSERKREGKISRETDVETSRSIRSARRNRDEGNELKREDSR